jgi:uncharacterized lipoprotein
MFNTYLKKTLIISTLFTLMSCASVPTDINIAQELNLKVGTYTFTNPTEWQISSQDLRIARHLVQIVDGNKAAKLINEHQSLRLLIENNLSQAWMSNDLKINNISDYTIDIKLLKALATVTEAAVSYEVRSEMMIKVQLEHQGKKFVKLFSSNSQWEAPFSASIPRMTSELNTQLVELLNQIVQDQELNTKLQQF